MELVEGETLRQLLGRPLAIARLVELPEAGGFFNAVDLKPPSVRAVVMGIDRSCRPGNPLLNFPS